MTGRNITVHNARAQLPVDAVMCQWGGVCWTGCKMHLQSVITKDKPVKQAI